MWQECENQAERQSIDFILVFCILKGWWCSSEVESLSCLAKTRPWVPLLALRQHNTTTAATKCQKSWAAHALVPDLRSWRKQRLEPKFPWWSTLVMGGATEMLLGAKRQPRNAWKPCQILCVQWAKRGLDFVKKDNEASIFKLPIDRLSCIIFQKARSKDHL